MEPFPRIFNSNRRKQLIAERSNSTPEEYIEYSKISIYLQDATKVILDRRDEKPLDLLQEYFSLALKGEHVLLRDYAFISASQYNRACFMSQMNVIFHSSPYYKVLTALDYHQCLCLLCSDFPRTLIADAARILPPHQNYPSTKTDTFISTLSQEPALFDKFDIEDLRLAVQLFFYYSEFMDKLKETFTELSCGDSDNAQVAISLVFSAIEGMYKKSKIYMFPAFEQVCEAIVTKSQKKMKMNLEEMYLIEEMQGFMTGAGTISFNEFTLNLMKNPTMDKKIAEQAVYSPPQEEKLKEIALQEVPQSEPNNQQGRRVKSKKKK